MGDRPLTVPAPSALLLGIDIGTTLTKAVLLDAGGRTVAEASAPTPFSHDGAAGRSEMAVDDLLATLRTVLVQLDAGARRTVAAVGLAGMAESGAPLDRDRRPLAPVIAWHDERGEDEVGRLEAAFGPDLALRIGQPARTVMTTVKLGWLLAHGTATPQRWLGVPELGLYALTGAEHTDFSLAARTGCYDVVAQAWIPEVAATVGFTTDVFPPIGPAGTVMGRTAAASATWSGLPAAIPVTVAGHDHLAGLAGAAVGRHELANSVGTAETVAAVLPAPPDMGDAIAHRVSVTLTPDGTGWAALVSAARAGVALLAAADRLGHTPEQLDALVDGTAPPEADFAGLVEALAHRRPAQLPPGAAPGAVWAGLLDALAARTAEACGRLAAVTVTAEAAERMIVFGGGSVSRPWLEAKARHLGGRPAVVASPVQSAVARGAAVTAGVAAGWWPSPAAAPPP